jgi:hypothetical protein
MTAAVSIQQFRVMRQAPARLVLLAARQQEHSRDNAEPVLLPVLRHGQERSRKGRPAGWDSLEHAAAAAQPRSGAAVQHHCVEALQDRNRLVSYC